MSPDPCYFAFVARLRSLLMPRLRFSNGRSFSAFSLYHFVSVARLHLLVMPRLRDKSNRPPSTVHRPTVTSHKPQATSYQPQG
jgi:hypothetical protein